MSVRKTLVFPLVLGAFLLQSCSPDEVAAIQTAVAETKTVEAAINAGLTATKFAVNQEMIQLATQAAGGCGDSVPPRVGYGLIIGDFVWFDSNANSLQDPLEPGVPDVPVELGTIEFDGDVPVKNVIASTITDSTGHYYFCFPDGVDFIIYHDLRIFFGAPPSIPDYIWVDLKFGGGANAETDSNARTESGWSNFFGNFSGSSLSIDAGLRHRTDADAKTATAGTPNSTSIVTITGDVNCRSGPGADYGVVTSFEQGDKEVVVAVLPGSQYVVVRTGEGYECWLWLQYAEPKDFGDMGLREATQPPTPTPHPTETPKPTKTPSPTPTPTPTPSSTPNLG